MKFISFLGTGPDGDGYDELDYRMGGHGEKISTDFVQRAEIEFLGKEKFEKIYILCTHESHRNFFPPLRDELCDDLDIPRHIIEPVKIGKITQPPSAWMLFEEIAGLIEHGDTLVFDLTHGFRSLSIILSAALNYILKAKNNISLKHVLYGEKNTPEKSGQIIDMKDFYTVNEWADAVSRFIDDADMSKLADLACRAKGNDVFRNLRDESLIDALKILTATLKNIDVNRIAANTNTALESIKAMKAESDGIEKELLELVENKFKPLAMPNYGCYDSSYFHLQLKIIRMLNQHQLYMQSYTVFRELIGSIGMLGAPSAFSQNMWGNNEADKRESYAGLFLRMMTFNKKFKAKQGDEEKRYKQLNESIVMKLEELGFITDLKAVTKRITEIRNGFDHAWTGKGNKSIKKIGNIETKANNAADVLEEIIKGLIQSKIIPSV